MKAPSPTALPLDPLRDRLRRRRVSLGLTFQAIAARAEIRSAAYVFHIENGQRVPTEAVAVRLARALGEDERAFAAWARALQRTDLGTVLGATRELLEDPELASFAEGTWTPPDEMGEERAATPTPATLATGARLRVPLIHSGMDPGDALRPACPILRTLSLDARALSDPETFVRPFAYVLGSETVRRVPDLSPGRIAILTRTQGSPAPEAVHGVRIDGRIELARVLWNGRDLLVLPAPGASDFVVLEAKDPATLRACIAGTIARVLHPAHL